jgi:hypothetical protein
MMYQSSPKIFNSYYGSYLLYSPGIDRILCVDYNDPFTAMTSAQVLSSKLPLVVGLVKSQLNFDPERSLEYSIKDKNIMFAFSSIFYSRQWPSFKRLSNQIEYLGWPVDYEEPDAKTCLINLKNYAEFVCQAVKAIKLTTMIFNSIPSEIIADQMLGWEQIPEHLHVASDHTGLDVGIERELMLVLYSGKSVEEALAGFENIWSTVYDAVLHRNQFYQMLGIDIPDSLKDVNFSGNITGFAV